jgi:hypothetical protein
MIAHTKKKGRAMPQKKEHHLYGVHLTSYVSQEAKDKVDRGETILADDLKSECFYCDYNEKKAAFVLYQVALQATVDPLAKTILMTKAGKVVVNLQLHYYRRVID